MKGMSASIVHEGAKRRKFTSMGEDWRQWADHHDDTGCGVRCVSCRSAEGKCTVTHQAENCDCEHGLYAADGINPTDGHLFQSLRRASIEVLVVVMFRVWSECTANRTKGMTERIRGSEAEKATKGRGGLRCISSTSSPHLGLLAHAFLTPCLPHPTNSRNALSGNLPIQHRTSVILDCELQSLCTGSNSCCEWLGVLRFLGVMFQVLKMILVAH